MRAEAAGDPGPWRQQAILGRGRWDADALRDIVRDYALETLADDDAVLVVDETGFLKQGKASCGVARQYTGSAGKITNCQIGVFACYVAPRGHAFIDRELYLPKSWTDDPARMAKAHVPQEIIDSASGGFATKPALALAMIERAIAASVPFSFVAADSVYGVGDIEMALRRAGKGYVLGVKCNHPFRSWGKPRPIAGTARISPTLCPILRVAASFGGRGNQRRAVARLGLSRTRRSRWRRIQRSARRSRMDARPSDPAQNRRRRPRLLHDMVLRAERPSKDWSKIEGHRWAIEDSFETTKNELGLDHNETRSWHGWRRHVSLVMLAFAMMAAIRVHANTAAPPPKTMRRKAKTLRRTRSLTNPSLIRWSIQEIRRIATRLARKTHPTRLRHRMVPLATSPSSPGEGALT